MTTWKDGGHYGHLCQEITDEDSEHIICAVWTKQFSLGSRNVEPYPQGEANFRLILNAPEMLAALEAIAELAPGIWCHEAKSKTVCDQCQDIARAAIAAAKGESNESELV